MYPIVLSISFLIAAGIVLMIYFWLSDYFELRTIFGYIPGPSTWPFLGLSRKIGRVPIQDRFQWLNDLCFTFEDGMVVTWFGMQPYINLRKPKHMQVMLSGHSFIAKARQYNVLTPWLDDSLLTLYGNDWIHRRHLLSPAFNSDTLEIYYSTVRKNSDRLAKYLRSEMKKNPKAPVDIFPIISKYALSTICKIVTDENIDVNQETPNKYVQALYRIYQISTEKFYQSLSDWNLNCGQKKSAKDFLSSIKIFHDFIEEVIRERIFIRKEKKLTAKKAKEESVVREKDKSVLDCMLTTNEQADDPLTDQDLRQEIGSLIFSGHDTITVAVCWTLFMLGNNKKIQSKVHGELKEILGDNKEFPSIAQLKEMIYLDRVIKEVLRLYPSIPTLERCLENDAVIENYFIPRGTVINLQIYQLHHDPEVWDDPETFNPDRFLPENSTNRHPYAYIPFSIGPKSCIGQQLAEIEIKMILVAILRDWRVISLYKPHEVKLISNYILRPFNNKTELYLKKVNRT